MGVRFRVSVRVKLGGWLVANLGEGLAYLGDTLVIVNNLTITDGADSAVVLLRG